MDRPLDAAEARPEVPGREGVAEIVGREAELESIGRFLDDVARAPSVLVLEGDAGIGKTTLWTAGVRATRDRGYVVLASRPAESETQLSFAALGDLLADVADVLTELPSPQRHALEVALLLSEPGGAAPDQRAVAAGLLSAMRALSGRGPLVVAIDDVQWLDATSARLLEFVLRRVQTEQIGTLLSWRSGGGKPLPLGLGNTLRDHAIRRVEVGPLGLSAIHEIVLARVGVAFARPVLRRVVETSGGNPFFAVELARTLGVLRTPLGPGDALPVPAELRALVTDRLAALPVSAHDALLVTAALSKPTIPLLRAAIQDDPELLLTPAFEANLLERDGGAVAFAHPLLASAAYSQASPARRRDVHRRLAEIVAHPEERARHLALAAEGPDEEVALALEEGARSAYSRGATHAAVELCTHARRLTPPNRPDDDRRRGTAEAEYRILTGDAAGAREILEGFVATSPTGPERADLLMRLGDACLFGLDWGSSSDLYRQALMETADDAVRARCQAGLAVASRALRRPVSVIAAHARAAVELAERLHDRSTLADALAALALCDLHLGHEFPWTLIERACALEPLLPRGPINNSPRHYLAYMLGLVDDFEGALAGFKESRRHALEYGDEVSHAFMLARTSQVECLTGAWDDAVRHVEAGEEIVLQAGQPANTAFLLASRALIEAHLGRAGAARETGEAALELADRANAPLVQGVAAWALGLLAVSLEQPLEAHAYLEPLVAETRTAAIREPGEMRFVPDDIEALVALGRLEEAKSVLAWYEDCGAALDRPSARATAARCHGLIASKQADLDRAIVSFQEALLQHERVAMPLERARTFLALGSAQRRAGKRRAARESLGQALAIFDQLGAAIWMQRTRTELARIGGRAAAGRGQLTLVERRVAELVADGRTNKEVAAELVVTVRTIESTLTKVYAKLGVRSRTELARSLSGEQASRS